MAARGETYPVTAVGLSILGGLVYLLVGAVVAIVGAVGFLAGFTSPFPVAGVVAGLVVVGVLTIVFAVLLRRQPELGLFWGALIVVLALVSLGFEFGGFVIGFLLTLVGGILAISGKLGPALTKAT
ncbi:MAG: hypothetical protein ACREB9_00560 [Thermoplasmata archaeon]